jgi:hypothetical protein
VSAGAGTALVIWSVMTLASLALWLPVPHRPGGRRFAAIAATVMALLTGLVAVLADLAPAVPYAWRWMSVGASAAAAVVAGGAMARCVLNLADGTAPGVTSTRVQATILRGGAWIGALERLALVGTIVAGWPEGVAALIALKGLARYPELRTSQGSGASERFIIGTLVSLTWAAACGGIALLLLASP